MELYFEEKKEEKKKSKSPILIGLMIILLIILTSVVVGLIVYIQSSLFKVKVNGVSNTDFRNLIEIEQNGTETKMYFPIKSVASYLGFTGYTGDFKNKSEDSSKCYIDNGEVIAMFTVNSDSLIVSSGDADSVYEEYTLDEKVFEQDGQLYTTEDGLIKAFDITLNYNADKNLLEIYTTDYLTNNYAQSLGVEKIPKLFRDRTAILEGMMIVETSSSPKKLGVIDIVSKNYILETKYDSISYLPYTSDFLVQSNGKYGIMTKEGRTKVNIAYDDITVIDYQLGLYLVKDDDLFGVINSNGNTILDTFYQQVGVSNATYAQNALDNQYILLDTLIPVKYNDMWGFFDVEGNQITEFEFTGVGCATSTAANTYPTVEISSLRFVVVEKDKMYNLMDIKGKLRISSFVLNSVYLKYDAATGQNTYYMTYGGNTANIEEAYGQNQL